MGVQPQKGMVKIIGHTLPNNQPNEWIEMNRNETITNDNDNDKDNETNLDDGATPDAIVAASEYSNDE